MQEGTLSSVLKKVGDLVGVDEVVAQIETDKVTMDVRAPQTGLLTAILAKAQDTVTPGQVLMVLEESEGAKIHKHHPHHHGAAHGAKAAGHAAHGGRKVGLRFPPRIGPDGRRISALPAEEAAAVIRQMAQGHATAMEPARPTQPVRPARLAFVPLLKST